MFLIALTTRDVQHAFEDMTVRTFSVGTMTLTVAANNQLSTCITKSDHVSVYRSPTQELASRNGFPRSRAVFDMRTRTLEVTRPPASGRPIYTHLNEEGEFFCSTHVSLLRKVGVPIKEDTTALPELFVYRHIMPPRTLFANIQQLRIGGALHVQAYNTRCVIQRTQRYELPTSRTTAVSSEPEAFERMHDLLDTASAQHEGNGHTPIVPLSGGLDSSILYRICKSKYDPGMTYSTGFPFENDQHNREKAYAISAAEAFNAPHTYHESQIEEFQHGIIDAVAAAEEPIHHIQSVQLHLLFKNGLPKGPHPIISGDGADTIFGPGLQGWLFKNNTTLSKALSTSPVFDILETISSATGRGTYWINRLENLRRSRLSVEDPAHLLWQMMRYCDPQWAIRYFGVRETDISEHRRKEIAGNANLSIHDLIAMVDLLGDGSITQSQWTKLAETQGKLLHYPFLTTSVMDFAFSLPWQFKLKEPKYVLRGVARRLNIPEKIITRPKSCFGIRRLDWALREGPLEPLVPLAAKVIDKAEIRKVQSEQSQSAMTFWTILNYSIWKRLCIDEEPVTKLHAELDEQISNTCLHPQVKP